MTSMHLIETTDIFNERKAEIDFYFDVLADFESNNDFVKTRDNVTLLLIMKSNFILMLYNLVEACVSSGMKEVIEHINEENLSYDLLIENLKKLWTEKKVTNIYQNRQFTKKQYIENVEKIVQQILNKEVICFMAERSSIIEEGNLDARKIREICKRYNITFKVRDAKYMRDIKERRNSLAHGDRAFSSSTGLTIKILEDYKKEVFDSLTKFIEGMEKYCRDREYKIHTLN